MEEEPKGCLIVEEEREGTRKGGKEKGKVVGKQGEGGGRTKFKSNIPTAHF